MSLALSLDGVSILDDIESAEIVWDWEAPHAELEIQAKDADLWAAGDPATGRGTARISADFGGGNTWSFLLESREGEPDEFVIRGRTLSALMTADYAPARTVSHADVSPATLADLVQAHTDEAVTWALGDYSISSLYVWGGYPVSGLKTLAEMFGGVLQPGPAGGIIARPKHPFAPGVLAAQTPDHAADWIDHIIEDGFSRTVTAGEKYDQVLIRSPNPQEQPVIEQEPGEPVAGLDLAYLRVFWPEQREFSALPAVAETTAGTVTGESTTPLPKTTTERLKFVGGSASVRYPMASLDSVTWIGATATTPTWSKGNRTFQIPETGARIADVTYSSRYDRYSVAAPPGVDQVSVSFARAASATVRPHRFTLAGETGVNPAPDVEAQWLSDADGRAARAATELYDSYDRESVSLTVPDSFGFPQPGELIAFANAPVAGNFVIQRAVYSAAAIREDWKLEAARWTR